MYQVLPTIYYKVVYSTYNVESHFSMGAHPVAVHTVYKHTCIHTFIHIYMHTYIHKYIHTSIQAYKHTYIHTYIIHTYIHTYISLSNAERSKSRKFFARNQTQLLHIPPSENSSVLLNNIFMTGQRQEKNIKLSFKM